MSFQSIDDIVGYVQKHWGHKPATEIAEVTGVSVYEIRTIAHKILKLKPEERSVVVDAPAKTAETRAVEVGFEKTVKFMHALHIQQFGVLKQLAEKRHTSVQELLRAVIVPEWIEMQRLRDEWLKALVKPDSFERHASRAHQLFTARLAPPRPSTVTGTAVKKITQVEIDEMRTRRQNGELLREIARAMHRSQSTVLHYTMDIPHLSKQGGGHPRPISRAEIDEIRERRSRGENETHIALAVGRAWETVHKYAKDIAGFMCQKCKVTQVFTEAQLAKIGEASGKWVCPTPGCGEIYELQSKPTP